MKAYLQNNKAQYYHIAADGTVALCAEKKALQQVPEIMQSAGSIVSLHHKYKDFPQTGFVFRNDGLRILSYIFFRKGMDADCVLTIEPDNAICGNLDFSTARVRDGKEIRIACIPF